MANNPEQTREEKQDKKIVAIAFPAFFIVFFIVILLLWFLCICAAKAREEQQNPGHGDRARQQRQGSEAEVPAAETQLVCTYYRKADGWQEGLCGVCLVDMADGDVLRVMPACMHYFHAACVGEWLRSHATCPLCRAPLVAHASAA